LRRLVLIVSAGLSADFIRQSIIANLASMVIVRTLNVTKRLKGVLQSVAIDVAAMSLAVLVFRSLSIDPIRNMIRIIAVVLGGINYGTRFSKRT